MSVRPAEGLCPPDSPVGRARVGGSRASVARESVGTKHYNAMHSNTIHYNTIHYNTIHYNIQSHIAKHGVPKGLAKAGRLVPTLLAAAANGRRLHVLLYDFVYYSVLYYNVLYYSVWYYVVLYYNAFSMICLTI